MLRGQAVQSVEEAEQVSRKTAYPNLHLYRAVGNKKARSMIGAGCCLHSLLCLVVYGKDKKRCPCVYPSAGIRADIFYGVLSNPVQTNAFNGIVSFYDRLQRSSAHIP